MTSPHVLHMEHILTKAKPKMVYLAHPITTGDSSIGQNIYKIHHIRRHYQHTKPQYVLLSPYHHFVGLFPVTGDQEGAYEACIRAMLACDEVHAWGNWPTSRGCQKELATARDHLMPIEFFNYSFEDIR